MTMHKHDCLKSIPAMTILPTISAGIQMTLPAQINAKLHQGRLSLSGTRVNVVVSIAELVFFVPFSSISFSLLSF